MIILTRTVARAFRSLARKCVAGRSRGPVPPLLVRQTKDLLTLQVDLGEVVLTWTGPASGDPDNLSLPMTLLDAVEGAGDDTVEIDREGTDRVVTRWADRGVPRSFTGESAPVEANLPILELPRASSELSATFLVAMHEAGRTAAREPSRFALQRVQIRGKKGQVIGTDSKRAYLKGGFSFPFADDLLAPAVPVFGARDLGPRTEVRVGRTDAHLVVAVGPWAVGLAIDKEGKFPDVAGVLPKNVPTVLGIDDRDAVALCDVLPGLPGTDGEHDPVTLVADDGAFVRAGTEKEAVEVYLSRSTFAGPACTLPMNRNDLRRMLALGCRTLRLAHEGKPVVGQGDQLTFVAMPLDESTVAVPTGSATRLETDDGGRVVPRSGSKVLSVADPSTEAVATIPIPTLEERSSMKPTLPAAKAETNGEALDPLVEAEELRNALSEVVTRVTRLISALKSLRKEKRALSTVWQSLKDLHLGA